jgi:hypothetical protein
MIKAIPVTLETTPREVTLKTLQPFFSKSKVYGYNFPLVFRRFLLRHFNFLFFSPLSCTIYFWFVGGTSGCPLLGARRVGMLLLI